MKYSTLGISCDAKQMRLQIQEGNYTYEENVIDTMIFVLKSNELSRKINK